MKNLRMYFITAGDVRQANIRKETYLEVAMRYGQQEFLGLYSVREAQRHVETCIRHYWGGEVPRVKWVSDTECEVYNSREDVAIFYFIVEA